MLNRMLRLYLNLPIRHKILFWFAPLLVLTTAATGLYSFRIAEQELMTKIGAEQTGVAKQAVDHLDYIAQDAIDMSNFLFLTPDLQSLIRSVPGSDNFVDRSPIEAINRLMVTRPYFQYLTLYSSHFAPIQFNNKGMSSAISFEDYRQKYHYDNLIKNDKVESWSVEVPGRQDAIFSGDSKNKLLLTKVLRNDTDYAGEGVIIIGIDERDIRKSYAPPVSLADTVVINDDGIIMSDSRGEWIGRPMQELPYFKEETKDPNALKAAIDSKKWMYASTVSTLTGWHILVIQPRSELVRQLGRIQWLTGTIVCVTIVLSLILSWSVAGVISRPIRRILISMKKFQKGDFNQQVQVRGLDEIGQLGMGYNTMVGRIKELIDDVYTFQLKQKQAELKALQSQINPHFLYNTLNTIAWTAHKNNDPLVEQMIYALSGMFKISLNQGEDATTLQQEFQLLEHYLFLQRMRFGDKLIYELDLAPEAKGIIVPKLILQPLVENAVVHGIEMLIEDTGFVEVRASIHGGQVEIEVTDNGCGIPEIKREALAKLVMQTSDPLGDSYALQNIAARMRLFYGEEVGVTIRSEIGSGTCIRLTFPTVRR